MTTTRSIARGRTATARVLRGALAALLALGAVAAQAGARITLDDGWRFRTDA